MRLQAERGERGIEHQHAAGDDRAAVGGQAGQVDVVDAFEACSSWSRTGGSAAAVIAPLVSFIAAQISPIALMVPDEPITSCQPSCR